MKTFEDSRLQSSYWALRATFILVPILVVSFGPQQAVPIMAIAALIANVSRMLASGIALLWTAFRSE